MKVNPQSSSFRHRKMCPRNPVQLTISGQNSKGYGKDENPGRLEDIATSQRSASFPGEPNPCQAEATRASEGVGMGVMGYKGGGGERGRPGVMPREERGRRRRGEHQAAEFLIPAMFVLHETTAVHLKRKPSFG